MASSAVLSTVPAAPPAPGAARTGLRSRRSDSRPTLLIGLPERHDGVLLSLSREVCVINTYGQHEFSQEWRGRSCTYIKIPNPIGYSAMKIMTRDEVQQRMDSESNLALVEVLSRQQYEIFHLPGAINVPLDESFDANIQKAVPDKERPVIVYCANTSCDASPQAAKRMEKLGYTNVSDYEAGKEDWKEADLPIETPGKAESAAR